jgi:2-polyprenyl-6-methoxyphenol hydroxylase-like FAD-dependent oxidoreductase
VVSSGSRGSACPLPGVGGREGRALRRLRRGAEVAGLDGALDTLTADPVRVHARVTGRPQRFTGRVVLGCDGASSTIRQLAGITMEDLGFTERWLVVDIEAQTGLDTWDGVEQICDPARPAMFVTVSLLLAAACPIPAAAKLLSHPKMRHAAAHFSIPWRRYQLTGLAITIAYLAAALTS